MSSMESSESESEQSAISVNSKDSIVPNETSSDRLNFQLRSYVKEKRAEKLWAIEFNNYLSDGQPKIFATLGGAQFSIYECPEMGNIKLLMRFVDPDSNEDFWSCCWSINSMTHRSILITGGKRGVIRMIEPEMEQIDDKSGKYFIGHGGAVNQLKVSPHKPYLLASASSDRSIRLWNIDTHVCIATFHGENGHRDEIVAIDFNRNCTKLVSGGLDHLMAIWDLNVPTIVDAIQQSRSYNEKQQPHGFKTILQCFPIFRSRQIHVNYIDCIQWMNDLILSKSNVNDLYCWSPALRSDNGKITARAQDRFNLVASFDVENCAYYFMRFATDTAASLMALGNNDGDVYIWDLNTADPTNFQHKILKHPKRANTVARHVSFSRNGTDLVICCDDGSIWHYQRQLN